jgi:hypothetical protein
MALGALIETASLAANALGFALESRRRPQSPDQTPIFDWSLRRDRVSQSTVDRGLADAILRRCVNRRPYSPRALRTEDYVALEQVLPSAFELRCRQGWHGKLRAALLCFHNAKLRLIIPEAYEVHRRIIDWGCSHSADKVPDQALGVNAVTRKMMRWALADWRRTNFLNTWFAGTWAPRLEMDLVPGFACAAHLLVLAEKPPTTFDHYVDAGRAMQRLWLAAAARSIQLQPEMTPLIFSRYNRQHQRFSSHHCANILAAQVATGLARLTNSEDEALRAVFFCRVGYASFPDARSVRLPLHKLVRPEAHRLQE